MVHQSVGDSREEILTMADATSFLQLAMALPMAEVKSAVTEIVLTTLEVLLQAFLLQNLGGATETEEFQTEFANVYTRFIQA